MNAPMEHTAATDGGSERAAPAVEMHGLSKRYAGVAAVEGIELDARPGECLALVGHNGAGKTTLFKLMLGLIRPSEGSIRVLGGDPSGTDGAREHGEIGFLPENITFDTGMTGRAVIRFYAKLKGVDPAEGEALLEQVGLGAAAKRRIGTYSKGMRQRVGLAQTLLGRPRLLLLDEPTSGLDPALRRAFYEIIDQRKRDGATVIISSHLLQEIESQADRVAILHKGRLVASGALKDVRQEADLPVTIRVSVPACNTQRIIDAFMGRALGRRQDESTVVLTCAVADKLSIVRDLMQMGELVRDVETLPAGLDDLYRHYVEMEDGR